MELSELKVISYELINDYENADDVKLELVYGRDENYKQIERWAIRSRGAALGRKPDKNGYYQFQLEPLPSSRSERYYKEFRFESSQAALDFWNKHRANILATSRE